MRGKEVDVNTVWADVVAAYRRMTEGQTRRIDEIRMSKETVEWLISKLEVKPPPDDRPRPVGYVPPPSTLFGIRVTEDQTYAPGYWQALDRFGTVLSHGTFF